MVTPRLPAVKFRRKVYVGDPRHKDAIEKAFAGMSPMSKRNVCHRIADGKETLQFGWAEADGAGWEHDVAYQDARMIMYGFD